MTSEIRTNSLKSRAGLSTVTMTDTGPIISGVTTANNFKSGISNLHSLGLTLTGGQLDVGSNIKIGNAGVITATSYRGDGSQLTGISGGISNVVEDTSPQLGGELQTNGKVINFGDSSGSSVNRLKFGDGDELQLFHGSNGNSYFQSTVGGLYIRVAGSNEIAIASEGGSENMIRAIGNGAVELYHNNVKRFETDTNGVRVVAPEGEQAILRLLGDEADDANDSFRLNAGGGTLKIQDASNQSSWEDNIVINAAGSVELYYDNSKKFFTNSGGVTVEAFNNEPDITFRGASNLDLGRIEINQFATNYSFLRMFTLANGTQTEWVRLLDNGNFCVGGMVGSTNNNNIQSPGQGNGNTNIGSAMWTEGRFICNSSSTFSSFGRNSTGLVLSFTRQGGDQGGITVGVGYVSYGSGSDYRLKENVAPLTDAITRIKQLEPKRFNFIQDTTDTLRDGFLAHEVSSIVPEAITGTKDEVDSDNNPVYQQIDQAKLVPLLTASIQELITKVETLEQENIALRIRVTNLEDN